MDKTAAAAGGAIAGAAMAAAMSGKSKNQSTATNTTSEATSLAKNLAQSEPLILPFTLISDEIPPEILTQLFITKFYAQENVSAIDKITVEVMTFSSSINLFTYMRRTLKVNFHGRLFSGMITDIEFLGIQTIPPQTAAKLSSNVENDISNLASNAKNTISNNNELQLYRLTLKPKIDLLTRRIKCQIFEEQPLDAILTEIFEANGLETGVDFMIDIPGLKPIPYCVQYCESDFSFISRLLEDAGYYYSYQLIEGGVDQVLTIKGSPSLTPTTLSYQNNGIQDNGVYKLTIRSELAPGVFAGADFDYTKPIMQTFGTTPSIPLMGVSFEYPSRRMNTELEELKAKNQLQSASDLSKIYECESTVLNIHAGQSYMIPSYPHKTMIDDELFVIKVEHFGRQLIDTTSNKPLYFNRFSAVRNDPENQYKPQQITPWPKIHGYQTAVVVGPAEAELPDIQAVYGAGKTEATTEEADEQTEEGEEQAEVGEEAPEVSAPTPPVTFTDPQGRIAVKFIWNIPVDAQEEAEEEEDENQEEASATAEETEETAQEEKVEAQEATESTEEASETESSEGAAGPQAEEEDTEEATDEDAETAADEASVAAESVLPPPPGSCWVRVIQGLAGPGYGSGFIPRIGMEVIIVFENGDPNRPVCVGCVYNGVNQIPEPLFEETSRLVLSSMGAPAATPEDPCPQNLIMLQDMPLDEQQISIYGQNKIITKAMKLHETTVVSGNNVVNIPTGDNIVSINAGNNNIQIDTGSYMLSVAEGEITILTKAGALNLTATDINITAEAAINIKAGAEINITAGADLSIDTTGACEVTAGGDVSVEATGAVEISGGGDISVEAGGAVEVTGGGDVSVEGGGAVEVTGGGDVSVTAGGAVEVTGGGDVAITAGGACEITAGGDIAATVGGACEITAGGAIAIDAGGAIAIDAGGAVAIDAGGAIAIDAGGAVEIAVGGAFSIEAGGIANVSCGGLITMEAPLTILL